jgi:2-oxoglutarate dehydrogenase E1 component
MLAEAGILGFEYGYSLAQPNGLTLWEAQFGDFVNNAQAVIDLYIASGESKWQRLSGLVLLLPHGYEGMGPEHSSARLERFLQLCAEDNLMVCNPTTPAQYFHLLRRQVQDAVRKPLVVMTPKSLLRHPQAVSGIDDLSAGGFQKIIGDPEPKKTPRRVLLCSGKIYYDLIQKRQAAKDAGIAVIRMEQLFPFPKKYLREIQKKYVRAKEWFWVQEEPENMGAWSFVRPRIEAVLKKPLAYIGRKISASTATGFKNIYEREQAAILEAAAASGKKSKTARSSMI